ncbi:MAG TPA: type IV toxin-antitoxin system AbiEi family antitoxin [Thermoanaerobaculia bacterium]|nr:type IV toxin-antitoxin system AbiEi family antitoxin [Thermoanaerobaculia bacterium]
MDSAFTEHAERSPRLNFLRYHYPAMAATGGISEALRRRVDELHRRFQGPFSVAESAEWFGTDRAKERRLLAHLASRGWLSRVRRDAYITVPLGAERPADWREDPWVVAARVFAPGYLAGWTACEHWGLTEQIFRDIQVVTTRRLRHRVQEIQGTRFQARTVAPDRLFGTRSVWRGQSRVEVSDPSRTLTDLLGDPALGGGIRHVAQIVETYFSSEHRDDRLLQGYVHRLSNRTVWKRLGYLLESGGIEAPELIQACREGMSTGVSLLDPGAENKGPVLKRWNLRLNVMLRIERL